MRSGLALALALGACWRAPRAPEPAAGIPGLAWMTPARAWHASFAPTTIAADGDSVLLVGFGKLARFDLASGQVVREAKMPEVVIGSVLQLAPGRFLIVGLHQQKTIGFVVDLATLALTPVDLPSVTEHGYLRGDAVMLSDGGVVICGEGLPLAVYDPSTWSVRKVLDDKHTWSDLRTDGQALFGRRDFASMRIDLATGTTTALGRVVIHAAANGTRVEDAQIVLGDGAPIPIERKGEAFVLDKRGKRFAVANRGVVRVTELPANTTTTFDLGPIRHGVAARLAFAGDRIVAAVDTTIRVLDLATREVAPVMTAPFGSASHLEVADDGSLLIYGAGLWRVDHGTVTTVGPIPDAPMLSGPPGVQRSFVTADGPGQTEIRVFRVGASKPREVRHLPQEYLAGWVGNRGQIAVEALAASDLPARLLLSTEDGFEPVTPLAEDATIDDVDLDADVALVAMKGAVWPVRLSDPQLPETRLSIPTCGEYGSAMLERGGPRVVTFDESRVALWDRTTSASIASVRLPREVLDVVFIPHRDEVLVVLAQGLVVWSPKQRVVRQLDDVDATLTAVSADGHRLALELPRARYALVDLDALIAALVPTPAKPDTIRRACPHGDPFAIVPEPEEGPDEINDGDEGGD